MIKRLYQNKAANILEFSFLFIIILIGFFVMQKYIIRGFAGRWKSVADSFAYGRQFDPQATEECAFYEMDGVPDGGVWYNVPAYEACREQRMKSGGPDGYNSIFNDCYWAGTLHVGVCGSVGEDNLFRCCDDFARNAVGQSCATLHSGERCSG